MVEKQWQCLVQAGIFTQRTGYFYIWSRLAAFGMKSLEYVQDTMKPQDYQGNLE